MSFVPTFIKNPAWVKVSFFALILFLTLFADAILSYWVPNFLDSVYENSAIAGLVISFSSVVGLATDLILPQVLKGITVRKLIVGAIGISLLFSGNLYLATLVPWLWLSLLAMATWGIYYELIGFAQHQFVADTIPLKLHSATWGVLGVARSTAYFVGPLVGGGLLFQSMTLPLLAAGLLSLAAFLLMRFTKVNYNRPVSFELKTINLLAEAAKWRVLMVRVWPLIVMSIFLGLIDAFYWSVGAVWNQKLSAVHPLGGFFLSMYTFPTLFVGFIVAKMSIYKGKKRKAIRYWFWSAVIMSWLFVTPNVYWQVSIVFASSLLLSFSYPLLEGAYSDVVERMGGEKNHMIGLTNSSTSIAYIFGPALAGLLAQVANERVALSAIGWVSVVVAFWLFVKTPKKIKMPQTEIKTWKKEVVPVG
jgi:hypothetical protein